MVSGDARGGRHDDAGTVQPQRGDIVRDEAKRRGLKFSDESVGGMAHEERVKHGFGVWAERTVPHVKAGTTVIDGIRGREEFRHLCFRHRRPEEGGG